jgi:hypothetical protein
VVPLDVTIEVGGCPGGMFTPLLRPKFLHDGHGTENDVLGGYETGVSIGL